MRPGGVSVTTLDNELLFDDMALLVGLVSACSVVVCDAKGSIELTALSLSRSRSGAPNQSLNTGQKKVRPRETTGCAISLGDAAGWFRGVAVAQQHRPVLRVLAVNFTDGTTGRAIIHSSAVG
jgi:hypothetical protein